MRHAGLETTEGATGILGSAGVREVTETGGIACFYTMKPAVKNN